MIRHDQDPRFMSEVFREFRALMGSQQRATLAYRPQANGQQERSVQTVSHAIRSYVKEADQSHWDLIAEKLMWAINSSLDNTRKRRRHSTLCMAGTRRTRCPRCCPSPRQELAPGTRTYSWLGTGGSGSSASTSTASQWQSSCNAKLRQLVRSGRRRAGERCPRSTSPDSMSVTLSGCT